MTGILCRKGKRGVDSSQAGRRVMNFYSERKIEKNKTSITYFINDINSTIDTKNKLRRKSCPYPAKQSPHTQSQQTDSRRNPFLSLCVGGSMLRSLKSSSTSDSEDTFLEFRLSFSVL